MNGTSGHGSIPRLDNALVHLSAAVAKLGTWETPMRLNDTTARYFDKLAKISTPESAARYRGLSTGRGAAIQRYLAEHEPAHYSMLRTSVVPTILKAGFRMNVIPSEAEATIDVRALPDEDMTTFYAGDAALIGDPAVKIEPITDQAPPGRTAVAARHRDVSRAGTRELRRCTQASTMLPDRWRRGTDMAQLRAKGIQAYGIGPGGTETTAQLRRAQRRRAVAGIVALRFVEFTWRAFRGSRQAVNVVPRWIATT